ncbi:flagellar hook-basal body protein [Parachitinimonas caeni]|uniref:Flagellar hook-basal body complex protein n=1 Tax=Parachitinimonas caeni TaxID=3031301 RepID=A0ABT7DYH0_9NEIS|nr:flagellar hook-basal body complex protein [Parachitinimonas caeni]MDK2125116.1 flagellar hook-basal body complex protein [Parachitinimonas caeni]
MINAIYIGASGMSAQQAQVDTIANNMVNITTPGFKRSGVNFQNAIAREMQASALQGRSGGEGASGIGVSVAGVVRDFAIGEIKSTESPYDLAIKGEGFIQLSMPDGTLAYSRGGTLKVNELGQLVNRAGFPIYPNIQMPGDATGIRIKSDGRVEALMGDGNDPLDIGQIDLVLFANPSGLQAGADGMYRPTDKSGEPALAREGDSRAGVLLQGQIELSNVKMIDEMMSLMLAQRAYEMSSKVVQTADELMSLSNNLRR